MLVTELAGRLYDLFPRQSKQIEAWLPEFRTALTQHEGQPLESAFNEVIGGWQELSFPRPAVFAKACGGGFGNFGSGPTAKEMWGYMQREGPPLVDSSVEDGIRRFEEMFGEQYEPEGDVRYAAGRLVNLYVQRRFLVEHPASRMGEDAMRGARWKLTDAELADVKAVLDTRARHVEQWNRVGGGFKRVSERLAG